MKDFDIIEEMHRLNIKPPVGLFKLNIDKAKEKLTKCLKSIVNSLNRDYKHNKAYDEVADWLNNNKNKGLLLMGQCGLGKTLLTKYVIPFIIKKEYSKVFYVVDAASLKTKEQVDEAMQYKMIVLDDIGTEDVIQDYGNKIDAVPLIVDSAEKEGKLLLISTNLTASQLRERYGDRTTDRLRGLCRQISITGRSYR